MSALIVTLVMAPFVAIACTTFWLMHEVSLHPHDPNDPGPM